MRRAVIEAFVPELKGQCDFTVRGTGGSNKVAIARAFAALFKERKLRGKRITTVKTTIMLNEVVCCDICLKEICCCGEGAAGALGA
jgi:hypothetical protein